MRARLSWAALYRGRSEDGRVSIEWTHSALRLYLLWIETGGPRVSLPTRKGFGSVLIERAFPAGAKARCKPDYRPEELLFEVAFTVELFSAASVHQESEDIP